MQVFIRNKQNYWGANYFYCSATSNEGVWRVWKNIQELPTTSGYCFQDIKGQPSILFCA